MINSEALVISISCNDICTTCHTNNIVQCYPSWQTTNETYIRLLELFLLVMVLYFLCNKK